MPPPASLLALHGFWLMVFGLLSVLAIQFLKPRTVRLGGLMLAAAGLVGLVVLLCWAAFTWEPGYGTRTATAVARRFAFLVVAGFDMPFVQCVFFGALLWAALPRPRPLDEPAPYERPAADQGSGLPFRPE